MRNIKSGIIAFGSLPIPIGIGSTVSDVKEPSFTKIHDKCHTPVEVRVAQAGKQEPAKSTTGNTTTVWCPFCNTEAGTVVKGYEVSKGKFVAFSEEELDAVNAESDTTITLKKFVKATQIHPVMINKIYWLIPSDTPILAKGYSVLYQALAETKTVGIGSQTLWGKEHPCAIIPNQDYTVVPTPPGGTLQMLTLHVAEDLIPPDFSAGIPGRAEKKLAKDIIASMMGELVPSEDLVSGTRERMLELIAAKIEGREAAIEKKPQPEPVDDVMAALQASYKAVQKRKTPARQKAKA